MRPAGRLQNGTAQHKGRGSHACDKLPMRRARHSSACSKSATSTDHRWSITRRWPQRRRPDPAAWGACPERLHAGLRLVGDVRARTGRPGHGPAWSPHWWPRLLPGMSDALMHGVIRPAHAVRSLALALAPSDDALQRGELARALGYWAARCWGGPPREQPGAATATAAPAPHAATESVAALQALDQPLADSAGVHVTTPQRSPVPLIRAITGPAAPRSRAGRDRRVRSRTGRRARHQTRRGGRPLPPALSGRTVPRRIPGGHAQLARNA